MRIVSAISELKDQLQAERKSQKTIGFVPTMGALHDGHLRLVHSSIAENDLTVVSIFVNPLQFNNSTDLAAYPRVIKEDSKMLAEAGVDILFTPTESELYPTKPLVSVSFGRMADVMEGQFRPGHFEGVGVVVSKLFHMVQPDVAYFGLKDLQQFLLIRNMVKELSFPLEVKGIATVREHSGLAMSSRNRRLSADGLAIAANIYSGLKLVEKGIQEGQKLSTLLSQCVAFYQSVDGLELEYLEVVRPDSLESIEQYEGLNELAVCVAGYVEGVRLIDNLYLRLN